MRRIIFAISAAALLALSGCTYTGGSPEIARALIDYETGHYASAEQILAPLAEKTDENYVLNNLRLASVALADYDLPLAESAFYKAYEVMNSTGVNDGGRGAAAALIHEKFKIWKGEPFERAMCNFYLGTLYYMRQDYNNARAAFENAIFKLKDYDEIKDHDSPYHEVESDFTGAYVMLGRCYMRLGENDKAADMFNRAARLRPDLQTLAKLDENINTNVLLVVDFGDGPNKVTEYDNSIVTFMPRPQMVGPIPHPRVIVNGKNYNVQGFDRAPVDLLELAQDRKWQDIDTIRVFKSAIGTGLMAAGGYEAGRAQYRYDNSHRQRDTWAGAALFAAGALLKASSGADIRYWETLPRTTFILPLELRPGQYDITVSFGGLSQTWRGIIAPEKNDATYYMRIQRFNTPPRNWPPPKLGQ
jgi:tetratricopeptide (TPR) repeat protein